MVLYVIKNALSAAQGFMSIDHKKIVCAEGKIIRVSYSKKKFDLHLCIFVIVALFSFGGDNICENRKNHEQYSRF